jgi:putative phage-type endonuclease
VTQGVGDTFGDSVIIRTDVEPNDQWRASRRKGLGGSDAAAALGLSRWRGRWETYGIKRGELPDASETVRMRRGRDLEPLVADWFAAESGMILCNPRVMLRSVRWPFMFANPDRFVGPSLSEATAGVEIKATGGRGAKDWEDGGAPVDARLQCIHYLAVTGLPRWYLVAHMGGTDDLAVVVIERNAADIANLVKAEQSFWQCVEDGRPPGVDERDTTRAALNARWPEVDPGSQTEVDASLLAWIDKRAQAKCEMDQASDRLTEAENHIRAAIGEHETATYGGKTVATWKWQDRKAYEVAASRSRVLRIKHREVNA